MTDTTKQDPHAELMQLVKNVRTMVTGQVTWPGDYNQARLDVADAELDAFTRNLTDRITDLEAQLEAVGAGGVTAMMPKPAPAAAIPLEVLAPVMNAPPSWANFIVRSAGYWICFEREPKMFEDTPVPQGGKWGAASRAPVALHTQPQQIAEPASQSTKDKERLDFLDAMEGGKWMARQSVTNRGFRVHQSSDASYNTAREAIDAAMARDQS